MTRYVTAPATDRPGVMLEGMTLLYDRRSGATHILASPAPELLTALGAGPASAHELIERLGGPDALSADGDPVAVIAARLAELEAAGLVWRA